MFFTNLYMEINHGQLDSLSTDLHSYTFDENDMESCLKMLDGILEPYKPFLMACILDGINDCESEGDIHTQLRINMDKISAELRPIFLKIFGDNTDAIISSIVWEIYFQYCQENSLLPETATEFANINPIPVVVLGFLAFSLLVTIRSNRSLFMRYFFTITLILTLLVTLVSYPKDSKITDELLNAKQKRINEVLVKRLHDLNSLPNNNVNKILLSSYRHSIIRLDQKNSSQIFLSDDEKNEYDRILDNITYLSILSSSNTNPDILQEKIVQVNKSIENFNVKYSESLSKADDKNLYKRLKFVLEHLKKDDEYDSEQIEIFENIFESNQEFRKLILDYISDYYDETRINYEATELTLFDDRRLLESGFIYDFRDYKNLGDISKAILKLKEDTGISYETALKIAFFDVEIHSDEDLSFGSPDLYEVVLDLEDVFYEIKSVSDLYGIPIDDAFEISKGIFEYIYRTNDPTMDSHDPNFVASLSYMADEYIRVENFMKDKYAIKELDRRLFMNALSDANTMIESITSATAVLHGFEDVINNKFPNGQNYIAGSTEEEEKINIAIYLYTANRIFEEANFRVNNLNESDFYGIYLLSISDGQTSLEDFNNFSINFIQTFRKLEKVFPDMRTESITYIVEMISYTGLFNQRDEGAIDALLSRLELVGKQYTEDGIIQLITLSNGLQLYVARLNIPLDSKLMYYTEVLNELLRDPGRVIDYVRNEFPEINEYSTTEYIKDIEFDNFVENLLKDLSNVPIPDRGS